MEIKSVASVALLLVNMRVDRVECSGFVVENKQFSAHLPKEVAQKVKKGDYLEVLCVVGWPAHQASLVLKVTHWIKGDGLGEVIYCSDEYWQGVVDAQSPRAYIEAAMDNRL